MAQVNKQNDLCLFQSFTEYTNQQLMHEFKSGKYDQEIMDAIKSAGSAVNQLEGAIKRARNK